MASHLHLASGGIIDFNSSNITLTHVPDVGLTLKHAATDDNKPVILQLKSEENKIVADEVIASIEFAAGDDDGTDGATVSAGIHAIAEGTFAADANATKLVFTTGVSETAASSATAKMTLASNGNLTTAGSISSVGDMTIYDDQNNADTSLSIGTSATEALVIQVLNGGSNKTAEEIKFITKTASSTGNHGKMTFSVDETDILEINDSGINVSGNTIEFGNGATIVNTHGNLLDITEHTTQVNGILTVDGNITTTSSIDINGASLSSNGLTFDFAPSGGSTVKCEDGDAGEDGDSIVISAGNVASSGSTNKKGGDLNLSAGKSSGNNSTGSNIFFKTAPAGSSGATVNSQVTVMSITSAGRVGIGTTPGYPLAVDATGTSISERLSYHNEHSTTDLTQGDPIGLGGVQIYADGGIYASDFVAASDLRIKKDIVEIQDDEALTKFRLLKPCKYKYIDEIKKGSDDVYGFIAQEVKDVLPYAVKIAESQPVPNVYKGGTYDDDVITLPEPHGLLENGTIRLLIKEKRITCPYTIIDDYKISIDTSNLSEEDIPSNGPLYDDDGNQLDYNIFVYGTEVDDFHTLRKDAIWSTGIAALQEVDRQLQAEKAKTATLETQVADLLARVTALENP